MEKSRKYLKEFPKGYSLRIEEELHAALSKMPYGLVSKEVRKMLWSLVSRHKVKNKKAATK